MNSSICIIYYSQFDLKCFTVVEVDDFSEFDIDDSPQFNIDDSTVLVLMMREITSSRFYPRLDKLSDNNTPVYNKGIFRWDYTENQVYLLLLE
jgi:hypothetical protein